ncbi:hypothetical protein K435DRAFT_796822 [Dendrothele bispora CBS 962.96]|uniref:Myb/SANT-like domain-containing protein n=1 Tax=Dendrothele bispora (strain CBS 962.96) TaxID=1314807 RepID=A0A4S8M4E0_DENBC|nr:hypothetical protein K435DRAFT_796822 [Dendrothele bispora CBS 962.96]
MAKRSANSDPDPNPNQDDTRASWANNPASTEKLIELIKRKVLNGTTGKPDKNFKAKTYTELSQELVAAGFNFDRGQVKSRWNKLKKDTRIVKYLRSLSGFGWDEVRKVVKAEDSVWRDLLYNADGTKKKNYTDYNYFRTNSFPWYDDMIAIIGDTVAVGDQAFSSALGSSGPAPQLSASESAPASQDTQGDSDEDGDDNVTQITALEGQMGSSTASIGGLSTATSAPVSSSNKHAASPPTTPHRHKHIRPTSSAQIGQLVTTVEKLVTVLVTPTKTATPTAKNQKELAWKTIKKEEGLSPNSLAIARDVLGGGPEVVEDYLSFDADDEQERAARTAWLARRMAKVGGVEYK